MLGFKISNIRLNAIAGICIAFLTLQTANALPLESFYGKYRFSAHESNGYFNEKPLQDYQGTLTIKPVPSYEKVNGYEANAMIMVDGGAYYSAKARVRHGSMLELQYTNKKSQQVVAFCTDINSTARISKCEGSLSGNMNATTTFTLKKD